jgi:hypothetical protein
VDLQRLCIIFESEGLHSGEYIVTADGLSFLELTLFRCFASDETDKLGDTFLYTLLRVLCDLGRGRYGGLHDARDICDLPGCSADVLCAMNIKMELED